MAHASKTTLLIVAAALSVSLAIVWSSQSAGQEQNEGSATSPTAERAFALYCANCHGEGGRGMVRRPLA